jgi:putative ABC transport system substrate-binding protein
MPNSFTIAYRLEITSLAAGHRLPAVYPYRSFAEVGGLLSYGVHLADNFRRAATAVDPSQGRETEQASRSGPRQV